MAKLFAVTIIVIAIVSAIPILRHTCWMPEDISTHGQPIDEQMSETMAEAGICLPGFTDSACRVYLAICSPLAQGRR